MTVPEIKNIKVNRNDIFDYVVGNSNYDPIEKCIDCKIYQVFDYFIYNTDTKEVTDQDEIYISFCKQVSVLRSKASNMKPDEILRICEELEEISPKYIKL